MKSKQKMMAALFGVALTLKPVARCRVVAAITRRGKILSIGHNSYSSCRLARRFKKHSLALYNHAEINAIHNYLNKYPAKSLSKCSIYVCRVKIENDKFVVGKSKPCSGCMRAIEFFGIKRIVWMS